MVKKKGTGKVILVVGKPDTGKSYQIRELLKSVHPKAFMVYDIRNEYSDIYPHPFTGLDSFMDKVERVEKAVIVFEEATIFFNTRGIDVRLRNLLVEKSHKSNTYIFAFHGLMFIPKYVYFLSDYLIVLKTNDLENDIKQKFKNKELLEIHNRVNSSNDPHCKVIYEI